VSTMLRINGKVYQRSDFTRVSALVIFQASEELPTLGLTTRWDDLVALLKRSQLPVKDQGEWSATDQLWLTVISVWATLNASGQPRTLRETMDQVGDVELIEGPDDHQGKAKAPTSRQGSGRGGANPTRKGTKTRS
jgi:hypothetical protein